MGGWSLYPTIKSGSLSTKIGVTTLPYGYQYQCPIKSIADTDMSTGGCHRHGYGGSGVGGDGERERGVDLLGE